MRRTTISNLRQFMLALLLPAVAIAAGLQSCNDEGPGIPSEETAQVKSSGNPLMRSPEEALEIAQRAYEEFYGDGTPSSRGRSIIDCSRPVEVVRGARSRGGGSDTLLYIVNFVDDQGFAVIAAPRAADELLAVTSQGHYYPESNPDAESVPGFDLWMAAAGDYAASVALPRDTTFYPPIDTNLIVKRDTLVTPVNPGGNPPVTLDSTRIINPDDPVMLQQKEWNDTTFRLVINPQIRNSWGQGELGVQTLSQFPEGYLFSNGLCGCGPLAIAQACLFYGEPSQIYIYGEYQTLDWTQIRKHRAWKSSNDEVIVEDLCLYQEKAAIHNMVAWLCKAIGDKGNVKIKESSTGITKDDCLTTLKTFLANHTISNNWISYCNTDILPGKNHIMLIRGDRKETSGGHIWICDGARWIEFDHCFATRKSSGLPWTVQTKQHCVQKYSHFNWGWFGSKNGWYNQAVVVFQNADETRTYQEFQYVYIK